MSDPLEEKNPNEDKIRRKDPKMTDNVLKEIANVDPSEKFDILTAKYRELYEEYRISQNKLHFFKKKSTALEQETTHLNYENKKLILVRGRLEKLSREFQRQNKLLKEENFIKIKEEEERRRQLTVEFQKTLGNISAMMAESNEQNTKLGEENKTMAKRLSSIYEDFKSRQSEIDRYSKQLELERQLAETRVAKLTAELTVEKEKVVAERDLLAKRCEYLTEELKVHSEKAASLEKTVGDFQSTIDRSTDIFDQCKAEIANMNQQITNKKEELADWQTKHRRNLATIRDLTIINHRKCLVIEQINKKEAQLTKLCRRLQAERTAYINALRTNGYNPNDFLKDLPPDEPEEKSSPKKTSEPQKGKKNKSKKKGGDVPSDVDSLAVKELELADLKEELKRVQDELYHIEHARSEDKLCEETKEDEEDVKVQEKVKPPQDKEVKTEVEAENNPEVKHEIPQVEEGTKEGEITEVDEEKQVAEVKEDAISEIEEEVKEDTTVSDSTNVNDNA